MENPSGAAIPVDFNFDSSAFDPTDYDDFNDLYASQSGFSNSLQLSSLGNRKGYAGYEFDQPVEGYHVRNRVYLPEVGRWTRRDPAGYVDGTNIYGYCGCCGLFKTDSYGLVGLACCETCDALLRILALGCFNIVYYQCGNFPIGTPEYDACIDFVYDYAHQCRVAAEAAYRACRFACNISGIGCNEKSDRMPIDDD